MNTKNSNKLEITSYYINNVKDENPVVAYCSIIFNNCFKINKIRVIRAKNKYLVCMPSIKSPKTNKYEEVCHPINSETRKQIESCLLEAYLGKLKSDLNAYELDKRTTIPQAKN